MNIKLIPKGWAPNLRARGGNERSCCPCTKFVLKPEAKSLPHLCFSVVLDQLNEACACGGFLRIAQKAQAE